MLDAVGHIEDADANPAAREAEGFEEHRLTFIVDGVDLFQKGRFVDRATGQGPRVLGQSERGEGPVPPGEIGAEDGRPGDRERGMFGVDVERGHVELEGGLGGDEKQAGNCVNAGQSPPEGEADPGGIGADFESDGAARKGQAKPAGGVRPPNSFYRDGAGLSVERGSRQKRPEAACCSAGDGCHGDAAPAREHGAGLDTAVEKSEFPLGAADVRCAHGGEAESVERLGGKGNGDAKDG